MAPEAPRRPVRPLPSRSTARFGILVAGLLGSFLAPVLGPATLAPAAAAAGAKPAVCKEAAAFHAALTAMRDLSAPRLPSAAKAMHPAVVRFRSAARRAPAEIRADWEAMAGALGRIDAALQRTITTKGLVKGKERDALYALMRTLDADPALNRSAQAIDRWLDQACGLEPHYRSTTVPAATRTGSSTPAR